MIYNLLVPLLVAQGALAKEAEVEMFQQPEVLTIEEQAVEVTKPSKVEATNVSQLLQEGYNFQAVFGNLDEDGISAEFFSEVMMKHVLMTALRPSKENVFHGNVQRLKAFQMNVSEVAQSNRKLLNRRLQSTADTMSGTSGTVTTSGSVTSTGATAACSMPSSTLKCLKKKAGSDMCDLMVGIDNMKKVSTEAEACICDDCSKASELIDRLIGYSEDKAAGKLTEADFNAKGLDEIAALCDYKDAISCMWDTSKTNCKAMVTAMDSAATSGSETSTTAVNTYLLPALKCLCDDCKYTAMAGDLKPDAVKLLSSKDIYPTFKNMAKTFCKHVETVKCITNLQGNCKPPGVPDETLTQVNQVKDYAHKGLDCMCKNCPDALGKLLTIAEKQDKGEFTDDAALIKEVCGLYPDAQCLLQQGNCKDSVAFIISAMGSDAPVQGMTGDNWETKAKEYLDQLKKQCESAGVTVQEYVAAGEADGAISMQGAPTALALLLVMLAWTA